MNSRFGIRGENYTFELHFVKMSGRTDFLAQLKKIFFSRAKRQEGERGEGREQRAEDAGASRLRSRGHRTAPHCAAPGHVSLLAAGAGALLKKPQGSEGATFAEEARDDRVNLQPNARQGHAQ